MRRSFRTSETEPAGQRIKEGIVPNPKASLKEQVHEVMRFHHYARRTELCHWGWVRLRQGFGGTSPITGALQDLLGHQDVTTTQIYAHVQVRPGIGVRSPLD